jgi:hypothetical protein
LLDDLLLRQTQMASFLDKTVEQVERYETGLDQVIEFTSAHIANGLRISKVLREQQELQQRAGQNQFTEMVNDALDQISLKVELDL